MNSCFYKESRASNELGTGKTSTRIYYNIQYKAFHTVLNPGFVILNTAFYPGKDTFHTCNLKAVLALHFTPGIWNPAPEQGLAPHLCVNPRIAVLSLLSGETSGVLLVAAGHLTTESQSEIEQRGSCHVSNRTRTSCKLQPMRRNIKRLKACEWETVYSYATVQVNANVSLSTLQRKFKEIFT